MESRTTNNGVRRMAFGVRRAAFGSSARHWRSAFGVRWMAFGFQRATDDSVALRGTGVRRSEGDGRLGGPARHWRSAFSVRRMTRWPCAALAFGVRSAALGGPARHRRSACGVRRLVAASKCEQENRRGPSVALALAARRSRSTVVGLISLRGARRPCAALACKQP